MHKKTPSHILPIGVILGLTISFFHTSYAEELVVLNQYAKSDRTLLELVGDLNSSNMGRSISDISASPAFKSRLVDGPKAGQYARKLTFTGDNCGQDGCFAMYYFKADHGFKDLSQYTAIVFDIDVEATPTHPVILRIDSYPRRAEIDVLPRLPMVGNGWQTVRIPVKDLLNQQFSGHDMAFNEDIFSLGTQGTMTISLANIRWVK